MHRPYRRAWHEALPTLLERERDITVWEPMRADRWQIFRHITVPAILPVSLTLVLIRVIEAFKIVDLPNVLTNGGPGIATESLTLHAFMAWRTLDLGGSAAIAYMLLFLVTFFCTAFVNLTRQRKGTA